MAEKKDYYVQVAEKMLEKLRQGTAPWQKPWDGGVHGSMPMNPTTGKRYRGGNALYLMMQDRDDPRWMTYKQAEKAGAQVSKGARGTPVIYWKFEEEQLVKDHQGKPVLDEQGKERTQSVKLERPRPFMSFVFNAEQIEGLPPLIQETTRKWNPVERAETILARSGANIVHKAQPGAFYTPLRDQITLPEKSQFPTAEGYYGTALHELGHWTGHCTRLDRDLANPFGSEGYAREELRAEFSSLMLGREIGVCHVDDNHASYIAHWEKILGDDPRELFRAAAEAEKIMDYIMGLELKQEQKNVQEMTQSAVDTLPAEEAGVALSSKLESTPVQEQQKQSARTYLSVPFEEKEKAKSLGAKWDRGQVAWYIPQGTDAKAFEKWLSPQEAKNSKATAKPEKTQKRETAPRQYLAVPYTERQEAKAAGAKWDSVAKSWYAAEGADVQKLAKWTPNSQAEQMPALSPREEFAQALRALGCTVEGEHPVMDGQTHRIATEDDSQGAKSGFYVVHLDGHPAGYAKNNRSGDEIRWKSTGVHVTAQQRESFATECEKNRQEHTQALSAKQDTAALRILHQLGSMQSVVEPTPYMQAKGIIVQQGAFVGKDGKTTCLPAQDSEGKIWTMQYIKEDGSKRFAKDSRKDGCFHPVGGMDAVLKAPALVISEGYATASTLSETLGFATIAAFDAGNVVSVAKALHEKYPDKPIVIAGDDDRHLENTGKKNTGRKNAELAAQNVHGVAVFPVFAATEIGRDFKDFNDLGTKSSLGREAVARQIRPALEKVCALMEQKKEQMQQQSRSRPTI